MRKLSFVGKVTVLGIAISAKDVTGHHFVKTSKNRSYASSLSKVDEHKFEMAKTAKQVKWDHKC